MDTFTFDNYVNINAFDFSQFNLMQLRIYGNEHSLPFIRVSELRNDAYQEMLRSTIDMSQHVSLIGYLKDTILQTVSLTPNCVSAYIDVAREITISDNKMEVLPKQGPAVTVNCAQQYAVTLPPLEGLVPLPIKGFAADCVLRLALPLAVEAKKVVNKDATTLTALHSTVFSTTYGTQCSFVMAPKVEPMGDLPNHLKGFALLGYIYSKMYAADPAGLSGAVMTVRRSETNTIRNLTKTGQHPVPDIHGTPKRVEVITSRPAYVPTSPVLDCDVIPLMYYNTVQNVHGGNGSTSSVFNTCHVDGIPLEIGDRDYINRCKDLATILRLIPDDVTDFYMNTGDPTYCKRIHKQIIQSRRAAKKSRIPIFVHHVHGTDMVREASALVRQQAEGGVIYHASLPNDRDGVFLSLESSVIENASKPDDIAQKMLLKHNGFLSKLKSYYGWHFVVDSFTLGPVIQDLDVKNVVRYYASSRGYCCNCIVGYTRYDILNAELAFRDENVDELLAHKNYALSYENIKYHVYHQVKHAHHLRFHRTIWNSCVTVLNESATAFAQETGTSKMTYHCIPGVRVFYLSPAEESEINASMWGSSKFQDVSLDLAYVDNSVGQNAVVVPQVQAPQAPVFSAPVARQNRPSPAIATQPSVPSTLTDAARAAAPRQPPTQVPSVASPPLAPLVNPPKQGGQGNKSRGGRGGNKRRPERSASPRGRQGGSPTPRPTRFPAPTVSPTVTQPPAQPQTEQTAQITGGTMKLSETVDFDQYT